MTSRARIGVLLCVLLIATGFLVVRLRDRENAPPIDAPVPPSSIPSPDATLTNTPLTLTDVAAVENPTAMTVRPGGGDLYVTEQRGRVRRIRRAGDAFTLDPQPFLDISRTVVSGGEQGLLGIAFAPDGSQLFVAFTNHEANQEVDAFTMAGDAVDESTRRTVLVVPDFAPNHNGGQLLFGPDGFLYYTMGDGGKANDPKLTGQDPHDLLGDVLRIDPLHPGTGGRAYAIPPDNPFADGVHGAPEVWAYGLRNPWRMSFDRTTRDVWIADVGQGAIEEIDFLPAGSKGGANFGWSDVEGTHPFRKAQPPPGAVAPIYEYDHSHGRCSVTGGFVYRGTAVPALAGTYLFADYCDGEVNGLRRDANGGVTVTDLHLNAGGLTSFGEDVDGEVYVLSQQHGVQRIDPPPTGLPRSLSPDPATAADELVAAERMLRDPSATAAQLDAAAHLQQLAYRKLGRQPDLDAMILAKATPDVRTAISQNLDARHELAAIPGPPLQDNLPAWRIVPPAPADQLRAFYDEAEKKYGVGWNYLAAINLIESALGRIEGFSSAGAQGPMQFIPSTWARYGEGDINSPHDAILGAANYLAANGFTDGNVDGALFRYNNSQHYVNAIKDIAAVLQDDPRAFEGYYRWEVFYVTTAGDVHLPVGYEEPQPVPAAEYVATHPQE